MCTPSIPGNDKADTLETLGFCPFLNVLFCFFPFLTFTQKGADGELAFAEHHSALVDVQYFQKNPHFTSVFSMEGPVVQKC